MAEQEGRRLPYGILWISFLCAMFVGAGLLVAGKTAWGLALFALPLVAALVLSLVYYLLERNRGNGPAPR